MYLDEFCSKYSLSVNLSKSRVVVFRNGGPLRHGDNYILMTFNWKLLVTTNMLVFTSRLCWSQPLLTLSDNAVFTLKRVIKTVGGFPISLSLDVFDKLVLPILVYRSEIWGTKYRESIELVHRKFCKYILAVSYNTSNAPVLGDLGRTPLSVFYKI